MKNKILGWDFEEAKSFLEFVIKHENKPFLWVFESWANKSSRQPLSVRNYFYKLCKMLKTNKNMQNKFDVSSEAISCIFSKRFNQNDEIWLLEKILPTKNQKSVRKACLNLAQNDVLKMVRFQNKFRHLVKTKPKLVKSVLKNLNSKGIETRNPFKQNNIVPISFENQLSDSDIQNLFMGLVKLVKTEISKKYELQIKNQKQALNQKIEQTQVMLDEKESELKKLELKNLNLKQKFELVSKNLEKSNENIKIVQNFASNEKMNDLKQFLNKLKNNKKGKNENKIVEFDLVN